MTIARMMEISPVIPVVVVENAADVVPLADALLDGGVDIIEITLRSEAALDAIATLSKERPSMTIGAGTVLTPSQMDAANDAGAHFIVSPGAYPELINAALDQKRTFLPGASTASEMMALMACGITEMKFFPAMSAGGAGYLKSIASPLADARFCPTGGISPDNASSFLELPNVVCVGGSWIATPELIKAGDFNTITARARAAAALK